MRRIYSEVMKAIHAQLCVAINLLKNHPNEYHELENILEDAVVVNKTFQVSAFKTFVDVENGLQDLNRK